MFVGLFRLSFGFEFVEFVDFARKVIGKSFRLVCGSLYKAAESYIVDLETERFAFVIPLFFERVIKLFGITGEFFIVLYKFV